MQHLAIIMDGNRRWAKENALSIVYGHDKGAQTLSEIAREVARIGIPYLTVFAFSAENWKRSNTEINALFSLMRRYLKQEIKTFSDENIQLKFIGDIAPFPEDLQALFKSSEAQTKNNNSITLTIAVNYGGMQDIINAASDFNSSGSDLSSSKNLKAFKSKLMTSFLPPVDMLIRTGKEKRISNFLIWDCAYAELYFSDSYWPEFGISDLHEAVEDWNSRIRRFGGSVDITATDVNDPPKNVIQIEKITVNER